MTNTSLEKSAGVSLSEKIETVMIKGDLSVLNDEQRASYYLKVCESMGLNHLTQPFSYLNLSGKLVLYANKSCTDQLRSIHKISIEIASKEKVNDVYIVTARAKTADGRVDESSGAVSLGKASGDQLANIFMRAETKAKRRVTLSICGLAFLDESEVDSIAGAQKVSEVSKPVAQIREHAEPKYITKEQLAELKATMDLLGWTPEQMVRWRDAHGYTNSREILESDFEKLHDELLGLAVRSDEEVDTKD